MSQIASRGQLRMSFLRVALVIVPLVLLLGIASGVLAGSGAGDPWFAALAKPAYMPPAAAFPIAWTILYVLIGFALALVVSARGASGRGMAVGLFVAQLVLNLAWSPLFFAAHKVSAAFVLILAIIVVAVVATLAMARVRRRAGLLAALSGVAVLRCSPHPRDRPAQSRCCDACAAGRAHPDHALTSNRSGNPPCSPKTASSMISPRS